MTTTTKNHRLAFGFCRWQHCQRSALFGDESADFAASWHHSSAAGDGQRTPANIAANGQSARNPTSATHTRTRSPIATGSAAPTGDAAIA